MRMRSEKKGAHANAKDQMLNLKCVVRPFVESVLSFK